MSYWSHLEPFGAIGSHLELLGPFTAFPTFHTIPNFPTFHTFPTFPTFPNFPIDPTSPNIPTFPTFPTFSVWSSQGISKNISHLGVSNNKSSPSFRPPGPNSPLGGVRGFWGMSNWHPYYSLIIHLESVKILGVQGILAMW